MQHIPVPATNIDHETLLRHSKRPQWGLGLCVRRKEGRWTVQFEDGKSRKLGRAYLHLLEVVVLPLDERDRVVNALTAAAGLARARRAAADEGQTLVTLKQQLRLFEHIYPGGFHGEAWSKHWRQGGMRRAKRHRNPAIIEASESLDGVKLTELLQAGYFGEVTQRLNTVLAKTSLVSKKQLAPLRQLSPFGQRQLAAAVVALRQAPELFDHAHQRLIAVLEQSGGASWPLVTAVPALLMPDQHVCVNPTTFRKQAQWMAPGLTITRSPSAQLYQRLALMVDHVHDRLLAAGHQPRDLFDVTDFMWSTLRRSALAQLDKLPKLPAAPHPTKERGGTRTVSSIGYVQHIACSDKSFTLPLPAAA